MRALGHFGEMYFAHDVAFRVIRNFRLDIYNKLAEIAPAYTLRKQTGQIGQAFVADVEILEIFLAHTFSSFLIAIILTVLIMIALLFVNPILSLLVIAAAVLLMAVPYKMGKKAEDRGREVRESLAESNVIMVESIQGIRELVMLGQSSRRMKDINSAMDHLYKDQYMYGLLKGKQPMATQVICGLFATAAVMVCAAWLVSAGQMDKVMYPVDAVDRHPRTGPGADYCRAGTGEKCPRRTGSRSQLDEEPVIKDEGRLDADMEPMSVRFENVSLAYEPGGEEVLSEMAASTSSGRDSRPGRSLRRGQEYMCELDPEVLGSG